MSKTKKFLSFLLLPACFVWLVITSHDYWLGIHAWKEMRPGASFFDATGLFVFRNIPTMITLWIVHSWYENG